MPIRTQNPWVDAGAGVNNGLGQLVQMYAQLPQVRAQMQQHADQMGIQQGHLQLQQQDQMMHAPLYAAEAEHYKANASKETAAAQQLMMLMDYAKQAQAGKYKQQTVGMTGDSTVGNAEQEAAARLLAAFAGSSALQPDAAQRALASEQEPLKLNMGQTAFSRSGVPFAQGLANIPFGNTVLGGMQLGGTNQPPVLQQGQFRPSSAGVIDPATGAEHLGKLAEIITNVGKGTPDEQQMVVDLLRAGANRALGRTNNATITPTVNSPAPKYKVKQIR